MFFAEHGWDVWRGALDAARVAALLEAFDRALPHAPGGVVHEVSGAAQDLLKEQLFDAELGRRAAELLGCARVRFLQDTLLRKPRGENAVVRWHQDYTYLAYLTPASAITARIALTPCTVESGCLEVLDGSHRRGVVGAARVLSNETVVDGLPEELRAEESRIAVELNPGDVSFHHCLTFHASGPNRSGGERRTLIARYFDERCRLDASHLPTPESRRWFQPCRTGASILRRSRRYRTA